MNSSLKVAGNPGRPRRPTDLKGNFGKPQPIVQQKESRFDTLKQTLLLSRNGLINIPDEDQPAIFEDFELCSKVLGRGTCGVVKKAVHTATGYEMAVKEMNLCSEENGEKAQNVPIFSDLSVMLQDINCQFIIKCLGYKFEPAHFKVSICMELMMTSMKKVMDSLDKPLPESIVGKVAISIIEALHYLKAYHNVCHRDVKPSNMLLSSTGVIKLCDFGISGELKDSIPKSNRGGAYAYMPPERIKNASKDYRMDIWSCGISLFELATGYHPYHSAGDQDYRLLLRIVEDPAPRLEGAHFTVDFKEFIEACLQKDKNQRPKYPELKTLPFYTRHNRPPYDVADWVHSCNVENIECEDDFELYEAARLRSNSLATTIVDYSPSNHQATPTHGLGLSRHVPMQLNSPTLSSNTMGGSGFSSDSSPCSMRSQSRSPPSSVRRSTDDPLPYQLSVSSIHGEPWEEMIQLRNNTQKMSLLQQKKKAATIGIASSYSSSNTCNNNNNASLMTINDITIRTIGTAPVSPTRRPRLQSCDQALDESWIFDQRWSRRTERHHAPVTFARLASNSQPPTGGAMNGWTRVASNTPTPKKCDSSGQASLRSSTRSTTSGSAMVKELSLPLTGGDKATFQIRYTKPVGQGQLMPTMPSLVSRAEFANRSQLPTVPQTESAIPSNNKVESRFKSLTKIFKR